MVAISRGAQVVTAIGAFVALLILLSTNQLIARIKTYRFGGSGKVGTYGSLLATEETRIDYTAAALPGEGFSRVKELAQKIAARHSFVAMSTINAGYLDFAHSWLSQSVLGNTEDLNVHDTVLFIATDNKTFEDLSNTKWQLHVAYYPVRTSKRPGAGDLAYFQLGYWLLMLHRTKTTLDLLQAGIDVFLMDTDQMWLSSPYPDIIKLRDTKKYDVIGYEDAAQHACGGFLYLRSDSNRTLSVWKDMSRVWEVSVLKYIRQPTSKHVGILSEQELLHTKYVSKKKLLAGFLPLSQYIPGLWYKNDRRIRAGVKDAVMLHNNWVIGNKPKRDRAKKLGHWFTDASGNCTSFDLTAIRMSLNDVAKSAKAAGR